MNLVRVIDPDTVVLGGGIVADGYMHEKILEKLHPTTMRFCQQRGCHYETESRIYQGFWGPVRWR